MSKHTPGPYQYEADADDPCFGRVASEDYGTIAIIHDPLAQEHGRCAELHATGELLAAAPALLAACERGLFLARAYAAIVKQRGGCAGEEEDVEMIRNAIAKAKGE